MSEYNNFFNFGAYESSSVPVDSEYPSLSPGMAQSEPRAAPPQLSVGLADGDTTAAQLQTDMDFAPSAVAESIGSELNHPYVRADFRSAKHTCAVCLASFQTDSALYQHAKETEHQAYKCKCGTSFNKHSALKRHTDTKDAPKTFACTLCHDKFTRKDKLKDHCRHYHKVTDEGLLLLFESQGLKPRAVAPVRRRRAPVPLTAASSGPAPAVVTAPPSLASAPAVPSSWSFPASTGQQYASFSTGPLTPAGPFATTSTFTLENRLVPASQYVPAPDPFATAPAPGEDISGTVDGIFWDETWNTGFGGFNF